MQLNIEYMIAVTILVYNSTIICFYDTRYETICIEIVIDL